MGNITLSINNLSIVVDKFLENKYPRHHIDPSSSFQEDNKYTPKYIWQFSCLLKPEDATKLHQVYREFLASYQSQQNANISIQDTTGLIFETQSTFTCQFSKPPKYTEEGAWVRADIELTETSGNHPTGDGLNGSLSMSIGGTGVTLLQRFMEEKFPLTWAEDSTQKLSYSNLGATILTGPPFVGKYLANISYNATAAEYSAIRAIAVAHNNLARLRQSCFVAVTDRTTPVITSGNFIIISYPKCGYNGDSKDRAYQVQMTLQEA